MGRGASLPALLCLLWLFPRAVAPNFLGAPYPGFSAPHFPEAARHCDVTRPPYSAKGDGLNLDTAAIQAALDHCGKGLPPSARFTVLLPQGRHFRSGALNLTSRCTLRIEGTLLASTDPAHYPIVPALPSYGGCRDAGYPLEHSQMRHQALLSAANASDVIVDGGGVGVVDGQGLVKDARLGTSWAQRFRTRALDFGRPRLWEPMFCTRVTLQNIKLMNQAFWAVHPFASTDVYIGGVNITAPRDEGIPNDDGIDPDSCDRVLVERCWVSVGDDAAAIKSGLDFAGREFGKPSANLVFRDSTFVSETFSIGSEMSGGVANVTVDNCTFGGDGSDWAGIHFKSKRGRGGVVRDVFVNNSIFLLQKASHRGMAFSADMHYGGGAQPKPTNASATPQIHGITLANSQIHLLEGSPPHGTPSFQFEGLPESPLLNFTFRNVAVVSGPWRGWSCKYVSGFVFENVTPAPSQASNCASPLQPEATFGAVVV